MALIDHIESTAWMESTTESQILPTARGDVEAYTLPDGRLLQPLFKRARIFDSAQELQRYYKEMSELDQLEWAYLVPDAPSFFGFLPIFIEEFVHSHLNRFDNDIEHPAVECIPLIDKRIDELGADHFLDPDNFQPLAAYVGELARIKSQGKWTFSSGIEEGKPFTLPTIITPYARYYHIVGKLRKTLYEWEVGQPEIYAIFHFLPLDIKSGPKVP